MMPNQLNKYENVKTVCLALGPYRNLTTLTAATLFLHPNCQVLNHAGCRIFGNTDLDFLQDFSTSKLDQFIEYAIEISEGGVKGDFGGSITHAHAFNPNHDMRQLFTDTGLGLVKQDIKCLFWKESLQTSNILRERQCDLTPIFKQEDRLRFLMPIRNPIDCALSNIRTGHAKRFMGVTDPSSISEVLTAVLNEIYQFAVYKEAHPNRFYYYLAHSINSSMLTSLASFLKLEPSEEWISNALSAMTIKNNHEHDDSLRDYYHENVSLKFSKFPELREQLLQYY